MINYDKNKYASRRKPAPIGKQFHELIVLKEIAPRKITKGWERRVICRCTNCGSEKEYALRCLIYDKYKSCGCRRVEKQQEYISQVDGVKYMGAMTRTTKKNQYVRVMVKENGRLAYREIFHVMEAKKVFEHLGSILPEKAVIHHIDHNKLNNDLTNLAVFSENGKHAAHHQTIEKALYKFVVEQGLLDQFYEKYPNFQLITLAEMLQKGKT